MTRTTKEYREFRETLNNHQLGNLKNRLVNMLTFHELKDGVLTALELGAGFKFHVYVDLSKGVLWLLGGHWVRAGEPTPYFLGKMSEYAAQLQRGEVIPEAD